MKNKKINQLFTSHYNYLDIVLPLFLAALGIDCDHCRGIVSAHGDKFYGYETNFLDNNISFYRGCAIGLLTYINPYAKECRETEGGWVRPIDWMINNKDKFLPILKKIEDDIEKNPHLYIY